MVKVSIIVYGQNEENLINCLDSIYNQTLEEIEVILINNELNVNDISKKYKNIIIIDIKNNKISKALNEGVKKATGEYITFINGNDYINEYMLEKFYGYAKKYDIDTVTAPYYQIKKNKEFVIKSPKFKIGNVKTSPQILITINYTLFNKLYKRQMIVDNKITFEEKQKYIEIPFVSKVLLHSKLIGQIDETFYYSNETTTKNIDNSIFKSLSIILDYYKREFYLKDEINYLVIDTVTTYMKYQKYEKDKNLRKKFINEGYNFLDKNIKNWKKNKYYKSTNFFKKLINNNKKLLNLYINIYRLFRRK